MMAHVNVKTPTGQMILKFSQFIIRKLIKIIAARCHLFNKRD